VVVMDVLSAGRYGMGKNRKARILLQDRAAVASLIFVCAYRIRISVAGRTGPIAMHRHMHMVEIAAASSKAKRMGGSIYGRPPRVNCESGNRLIKRGITVDLHYEIRNLNWLPHTDRNSKKHKLR
jgi:hypothetical protein